MNSIIYNTTNLSTSRAHIIHQALCHVLPYFLTLKHYFSPAEGNYVQNQTEISITKRVSYSQFSTMKFLIRILMVTQRRYAQGLY